MDRYSKRVPYVTSLGPWDEYTIIDYLADEYPDLSQLPEEQVRALIKDTEKTRVLTFVVSSASDDPQMMST